ncbi:unnamed protein product [Protopolystoma xenopodis]|uniref:Uncharacterized protein n=1 Tax=Protopolystoma xenopodis TaxID=117903 RepID=A0A448WG81_9PLAT|nr:unnamed protein product [Protopolystoma xenopodis]
MAKHSSQAPADRVEFLKLSLGIRCKDTFTHKTIQQRRAHLDTLRRQLEPEGLTGMQSGLLGVMTGQSGLLSITQPVDSTNLGLMSQVCFDDSLEEWAIYNRIGFTALSQLGLVVKAT